MKTEVFCTLQVEGTHNWPDCPFDDVAYLRDIHRHMFHIKAYKLVTHSNRDCEFIMLKHEIQRYLQQTYSTVGGLAAGRNFSFGTINVHVFGAKSCEMIAEELIDKFDLSRCEVSEDGENGAIVTLERP